MSIFYIWYSKLFNKINIIWQIVYLTKCLFLLCSSWIHHACVCVWTILVVLVKTHHHGPFLQLSQTHKLDNISKRNSTHELYLNFISFTIPIQIFSVQVNVMTHKWTAPGCKKQKKITQIWCSLHLREEVIVQVWYRNWSFPFSDCKSYKG